ncbi:isochorismate synthase [bacterium]|nr:isochorismate synthase [bacterium]
MSIFEIKPSLQLEHARQCLQEELRNSLLKGKMEGCFCPDAGYIHRIEVSMDKIDPLIWLKNQSHSIKTFWSDREGAFRMAGLGIAHLFMGNFPVDYRSLFSRLNKTLSLSHPDLRYYGGLRFDQSQREDDVWNSFDDYRFVIPRFEVLCKNETAYLACNFEWPQKEDAHTCYEKLSSEIDHLRFIHDYDCDNQKLPAVLARDDIPDWKQWEESVQIVMRLLEQGELQKIVLARKSILTLDRRLDPLLLLCRLAEKNSRSFHFCFQIKGGAAFIGATPELLYSRNHQNIYSEAIAGTRPRRVDPEEDQSVREELLNNDKELREHRWVSGMIRHNLEPICSSFETIAHETLLSLLHVHHLYSRFRGELKESTGDWDILATLQPTPAVGGFPRQISLKKIAQIEPFDRGWYAGPVGWVGKDSAEFTVGIRSALVLGNEISLFAGSGIVEGSHPQKEWEENESKLMNFTELFGNYCSLP